MSGFKETLRMQRHDDHRYYHHSRINQALHLASAVSFLVAYGLLLIDPPMAALVAWLVGMTTRQCGHFFFEPKGYDHVNHATHEHKEAIKVGYNLRRKFVLLAIWALLPIALLADPSLMGTIEPHEDWREFVRSIGIAWLVLGLGGIMFRMAQLVYLQDVVSSLAWASKIATDPMHDIKLYWRAPIQLWRGELFAPDASPVHR
jgi:hypothetical protein